MWASPRTIAFRVLIVAVAVAILLVTGLELPGWLATTLRVAGAFFAALALLTAFRRDRPRA